MYGYDANMHIAYCQFLIIMFMYIYVCVCMYTKTLPQYE